jgi:hypothetical protein
MKLPTSVEFMPYLHRMLQKQQENCRLFEIKISNNFEDPAFFIFTKVVSYF